MTFNAPVRSIGLFLCSSVLVLTIFDSYIQLPVPFVKTLSAAFGVCFAVWWIISGVGINPRRGPQAFLLLFILVVVSLEVFRYLAGETVSLSHFMQWFQILIFFYIMLDISYNWRSFRFLWLAFMLTTAAMILLATSGLLRVEDGVQARTGFSGVNLNRQAYWYSIVAIFSLWALIERYGRAKTQEFATLGVVFLVLSYAVFNTGSRGAFGAHIIGISALFALAFKNRNIKAYVIILPFVVIATAFIVLNSEALTSRLLGTLEGTEDNTRSDIWDASWELFKDNWIIGYGPGFQSELGARVGMRTISTHQAFLQILLAYGTVGFMAFSLVVVSIVRPIWKLRNTPLGALYLALFAASFVFGFVADLIFNRLFIALLTLGAVAGMHTSLINARLLGFWPMLLRGAKLKAQPVNRLDSIR